MCLWQGRGGEGGLSTGQYSFGLGVETVVCRLACCSVAKFKADVLSALVCDAY